MKQERITRRDFLKSSVAGAVGITLMGLTGCTSPADNSTSASAAERTENNTTIAVTNAAVAEKKDTISWVEAADVIIVGGGGAGFCAAIEAGRAGASVLILEKAGLVGGDTNLSNGMLMAAGTDLQKTLAGCDTDTPQAFADQQVAYAQGYGDEDMIREMCLQSPDAVQFMVDLGRVYESVDIIPPVWDYDTETSWGPRSHWVQTTGTQNSKTGHFQSLKRTVDEMDHVKYYEETEVAHLIVNETHEVIGVKTVKGDCYRANKGVVLATASFGTNREMCKRYNKMQSWALGLYDKYHATSAPDQNQANTGDGIRMAQEIGADLALTPANVILDMNYMGGVGAGFYNTSMGLECTNPYFATSAPGKIFVNNRGQRFVQEDAHWGYVNQEVFNEAMRTNWEYDGDIKIWLIQDSACMAKDVLSMASLSDLTTNYGKLIQIADTLEELAEKIHVPADNLLETVARWNRISEEEKDPDFGRRTDFGKIETGPFYAYPYIPNTYGSLGGLRTDRDTRVIDVNGTAIPRLYAAGTIMSGMFCGPFYSACGWAILGTVHWGRKAGKNVAALEAWTTENVEVKETEGTAVMTGNGNYTAGTYTATAAGRNGDVTVEVTFSDTAITAVTVTEHGETQDIGTVAIEKLPERILAAQSADIDVISSVTITSEAILTAVKDCIQQAAK